AVGRVEETESPPVAILQARQSPGKLRPFRDRSPPGQIAAHIRAQRRDADERSGVEDDAEPATSKNLHVRTIPGRRMPPAPSLPFRSRVNADDGFVLPTIGSSRNSCRNGKSGGLAFRDEMTL